MTNTKKGKKLSRKKRKEKNIKNLDEQIEVNDEINIELKQNLKNELELQINKDVETNLKKELNLESNNDMDLKANDESMKIKKENKIFKYIKNLYVIKKTYIAERWKEFLEVLAPSEIKNVSKGSCIASIVVIIVSIITTILGYKQIIIDYNNIQEFNDIYKVILIGCGIYFGIVFGGLAFAVLCNFIYSRKKEKITKVIVAIGRVAAFTILLPMLIPVILLKTTSKKVKMDLLLEYFPEVMIGIVSGLLVGLVCFYKLVDFVVYATELARKALHIPIQLISLKGIVFILLLLLLIIINFTAINLIKFIFIIRGKSHLYTKEEWRKRRDLLLMQFKLFKYCLILFATFSLKVLDFNALSTNYANIAENNKKNGVEYKIAEKKSEDAKNMGIYVEALFYSTSLFTLARTVSSVAGDQKKVVDKEVNQNDNSSSI